MRNSFKSRIAAAGTALAIAGIVGTISLLGGGSASAANQPERQATSYITNTQGVITNWHLGKGTVYGDNMGPGVAQWFLTTPQDSITTGMIKANQVTESKLDPALREKINATDPEGPSYLSNWGTLHRNTIGAATATLENQSIGGSGLSLNVADGASKVAFGNEVDFVDKPVPSQVGIRLQTTKENSAVGGGGNNMPSVILEIDPDVDNGATPVDYTSMVYTPDNTPPNAPGEALSNLDSNKNVGFTGPYFNDPAHMNERCGMNGTRCTWAEAKAVLGEQAKVLSFSVSKGRDKPWHGVVRGISFGTDWFTFTKDGVTK